MTLNSAAAEGLPPPTRLAPVAARGGDGWTLPAAPTPLVGRSRELATVVDLLHRDHVRLLTLTGPGGVGKSRLGLAAAGAARELFRDGVVFVPLAAIGDPEAVLPAIAQVLGLRESGGESAFDRLARSLGSRQVLLVLDNFEQVAPAAPGVSALLRGCPELKVLVTSRAPLHIAGEHEFPVPSLPRPPAADGSNPERLALNDAVALFLQRGRAVKPDLVLTAANGPAIAEICHRLDGLPLAIELAAARSKVLTPEALLPRLDQRLRILTGGSLDQPPRLRSMRDAIAWSHDLLDPAEQVVFRRLAVFRGGFGLDAAEAVSRGSSDEGPENENSTLDSIASLVDKSLLGAPVTAGGEPWFGMLETIREYAEERLAAAGESEDGHRRHAAWYVAFAERAKDGLVGGNVLLDCLARLDAENANLRAALTWLGERGSPDGLGLAVALHRFWLIRGRMTEGRVWLEQMLSATDAETPLLRGQALTALAHLAIFQGDFIRADHAIAEAERLIQATGDRRALGSLRTTQSTLAFQQGDVETARARAVESVDLLADTADDGLLLVARICVAAAVMRLGDLATAKALGEECLALGGRTGDEFGLATTYHHLATVSLAAGDFPASLRHFAQALIRLAPLSDAWAGAFALNGMATAAVGAGRNQEAARMFGASARLQDLGGVTLPAALREWYDQAAGRVRTALGDRAYQAARAAGATLSLDEVIAEAVALAAGADGGQSAATAPGRPAGLSEREVEVLRLVADGLSNAQIAERLFVSRRTVDAHLYATYRKLAIASRAEAVRFALDHGLV